MGPVSRTVTAMNRDFLDTLHPLKDPPQTRQGLMGLLEGQWPGQPWSLWLDRLLQIRPIVADQKPDIRLTLREVPWAAAPKLLFLWLLDRLQQEPDPWKPPARKVSVTPLPLEVPVQPDASSDRAWMLTELEPWRIAVDWEHLQFGARAYDEGLHGGEVEPHFLANFERAHSWLVGHLGTRLTVSASEQLTYLATEHELPELVYDCTPRNLSRMRAWMRPGVLDSYPPEFVKRRPYRRWELEAFKALYKDRLDQLMEDVPGLTSYLDEKYEVKLENLTLQLLNQEMLRAQLHFFRGPRSPEMVRQAMAREFDAFYEAPSLKRAVALHRWLEALHPFAWGNTRYAYLVLNKLLVEYGFCPTVMEQRCDAVFSTLAEWEERISEGMERWQAMVVFQRLGLLDSVRVQLSR